MVQMNGEWLGKRPMRINRAAKYTADTDEHHHQVGAEEGEFFFVCLLFFSPQSLQRAMICERSPR